jgi:aerobic C4-dicarboxylate transport protein
MMGLTNDTASASYVAPRKRARRAYWRHPNLLIVLAVGCGAMIGWIDPKLGVALRPLADMFIGLIKLVIGPIVFLIITTGIAQVGDMRKVGRIGIKALIYFEVLTMMALIFGFIIGDLVRPGDGVTPPAGDVSGEIARYTVGQGVPLSSNTFFKLIPNNLLAPFLHGDLLQILVLAVMFGTALVLSREKGRPIVEGLERMTTVVFKVTGIVMLFAPLGVLGAIGFTVGEFGITTLLALAKLVLTAYASVVLFVGIVLALVCRIVGLRLMPILRYIRSEILIALATSSSESVLPQLAVKLDRLGVSRAVVGLVLPTSYSFNLTGVALTLPISVLFIVQVYGLHLTWTQQASIFGLMLLTSKGAAGVTGAAFVTLAATVAATGVLPLQGLVLLLAVDRFLSEARAVINIVGNVIATIIVGKWEDELDAQKMRSELRLKA